MLNEIFGAPHSRISLYVEKQSESPVSFHIDSEKVFRLFISATLVFAMMAIGSLLFFRELEINRKLSERLLELETKAKLDRIAPLTVAIPPKAETKPQEAKAAPDPVIVPIREESAEQVEPILRTVIHAKLEEFDVTCVDASCEIQVELVPAGTGLAQGEVLFVLETEVVRIGTTAVEPSQARKRFLIEPGNIGRDSLTPQEVPQIAGKPFRFSRALQTKANFSIGRTLHPVAANIYVFDAEKNLIHHERKPIEPEGQP